MHGAGPLYARDLLASPLRKLDETIDLIRRSAFMPDHTRSGMLAKDHIDSENASLLPLVKKAKLVHEGVIEVKDEEDGDTEQDPCDSSETFQRLRATRQA